MFAWVNSVINYFKSLFWKEEMELTLVGLQNSGKTTFVNVIAVCYQCVACRPNAVQHANGKIAKCALPIAVGTVHGRYAADSGLQHEKGDQGECDDKAMGYWWPGMVH